MKIDQDCDYQFDKIYGHSEEPDGEFIKHFVTYTMVSENSKCSKYLCDAMINKAVGHNMMVSCKPTTIENESQSLDLISKTIDSSKTGTTKDAGLTTSASYLLPGSAFLISLTYIL